jgi:hypothetical protein
MSTRPYNPTRRRLLTAFASGGVLAALPVAAATLPALAQSAIPIIQRRIIGISPDNVIIKPRPAEMTSIIIKDYVAKNIVGDYFCFHGAFKHLRIENCSAPPSARLTINLAGAIIDHLEIVGTDWDDLYLNDTQIKHRHIEGNGFIDEERSGHFQSAVRDYSYFCSSVGMPGNDDFQYIDHYWVS